MTGADASTTRGDAGRALDAGEPSSEVDAGSEDGHDIYTWMLGFTRP